MIIEIKYNCKYRLRDFPNYVFCGKRLFNSKTSREITQVNNNGSLGFNIQGKFRSLNYLKSQIEMIPKNEFIPF